MGQKSNNLELLYQSRLGATIGKLYSQQIQWL